MNIKTIVDRIIGGGEITREEALRCYEMTVESLLEESRRVKEHYHDGSFDFCTIVNGKSGRCSEDCKYCAQSAFHDCETEVYDLLGTGEIFEDAKRVEAQGIRRYSIVTSGKKADPDELEKLCETYENLSKETGLSLCASHGLLNQEELFRLKQSGVQRIHNNLETSRNYFNSICTTHSYEEKIETIRAAQSLGLEVCSGGIIGMGETNEDRVDLAFELKGLGIQSVPLNLLNPIEGTAIAMLERIPEEEFLKTCAIFRLILPGSVIRLAGGRGLLSDKGQRLFSTCVNGAITGDLLTTTGNDTSMDYKMVEELGYEVQP